MITVNEWANTTGLTYLETVMRNEAMENYWDWVALFGKPGKAKHFQQKGVIYSGLGNVHTREALQDIKSEDMKEMGTWTITSVEYAQGVDFDLRTLEKLNQKGMNSEAAFVSKIGKSMGESFGQAKCAAASGVLTNAFDSTAQPMWDDLALCDTHYLEDGTTTQDNDLAAGSLTADTYWDMIEYLRWSQMSYKGLTVRSEPMLFICNPSNTEIVWQIQNQKFVPGESSSINDENFLKGISIKTAFNPDLGANERFMIGKKAKDNFIFKVEKKLTTEYEDHKRNRSRSALAHMILQVGVQDYRDVVGAPAS